ncbi:MAG: hypothetical protein EXS09_21985 [Gemmataceae bacterium]|nr:hypothetical protein [Gemmataceae bacterium]
MKRWHQDETVTLREWRHHHRGHVEYNKGRSQGHLAGQRLPGSDPRDVDCNCDDQPGRFRKRHAHDCGKARCQICHGYKFPCRRKSAKERLADMALKEQIRETLHAIAYCGSPQ